MFKCKQLKHIPHYLFKRLPVRTCLHALFTLFYIYSLRIIMLFGSRLIEAHKLISFSASASFLVIFC